jgi:hypothetical protein
MNDIVDRNFIEDGAFNPKLEMNELLRKSDMCEMRDLLMDI